MSVGGNKENTCKAQFCWSIINNNLAHWYEITTNFRKALLNLPLVWVERGEPHEEEREDEEDKDQPPECVNHTHSQRDGQGAHINKYKSATDGGWWKSVESCFYQKKSFMVFFIKVAFFLFVPGWSSQGVSMEPTIVIFSLHPYASLLPQSNADNLLPIFINNKKRWK